MKKTVKKNIIILILTFVIIVCLVGSFIVYAKSEEEKPILQTKVTEELNYLENYLVSILGDFNSLSIHVALPIFLYLHPTNAVTHGLNQFLVSDDFH